MKQHLVIFDTTFPNFVFTEKADHDYTQTPWVTYTMPAANPQRKFGFTPPLLDAVRRATGQRKPVRIAR